MAPPISEAGDHAKKCTDANNSENNATRCMPLKFGALTFDGNYEDNIMEIFSNGGMSSSIIFIGAELTRKKREKTIKQEKGTVHYSGGPMCNI